LNVLIIPEDFRKDQYMLKPLISAMMVRKGKPTAKVRVCQDPRLGGIDQALRWERIEEIIDRYKGMVNLFLLCVDRDGNQGRREVLDRMEQSAAKILLPIGKFFLAENAWQEIEVWVLAGHQQLPSDWSWEEIRSEHHPKEKYFLPFAKAQNLSDEPGEGRKTLAQDAARNYNRIRTLCPEIAELEKRIT
jgi:hypothetical protein